MTRPRKVLTVFAARGHRDTVRRLCRSLEPASQVTDVASATDAVLTLLTGPMDLVLVDAGLAGDLLGALLRHAQRSAPRAKLAVFAGGALAPGWLPWSQLEATLLALLARA
ncbi:hypothetical protein RD110_08625 [Rhodoferax koreense]|uniref:Response regulatory domain-containing protein n=1 Tax=Rhodoferax koreensis TaxID=1842727 RepID=A0A1P8JU27_9BURK|nr:hypothetical protein [Rhodoferax koreense]APW37252.1 hypothetical protein RD110_08625 [Rhodoferax koreense]